VVPRLKEQYTKDVAAKLRDHFKYGNVMQVPKLEKIVVNMGVGEANLDAKLMDSAMVELGVITGQRPSRRKARRSISNFKLRQGMYIGCTVTLRGDRMYEFMDRLISVAIPRIRDFRGISPKSFDGQGNYTLGLTEQTIFPEVNQDNVERTRGMNITFVVKNGDTAEESRELLRQLGMPFHD
jgi:large subunit ribosomal protein L5